MAKDVQDILREALVSALDGASGRDAGGDGGGALSGMRGVIVGAGAAALAPMALRRLAQGLGIDGIGDVVKAPAHALGNVTSDLGERIGSGIGEKVSDKVDDAGGPAGILGDTLKNALPFGGGGDDGPDGDVRGVGKGRRMPVQQSVDIGAPLETVYNQWTQFEDWPLFMHRVISVTQEDDCTVSFMTKIWGKKKEFTATIETQRPDERVKWKVSEGMAHAGVVSFHEIAPGLTRVLLGMDVEPGGMLEKAARGLRHVKRAARGDLHRFKAFIEMSERETGAWRGVIEDGEVVEEHDPKYDRKRDYADPEELMAGGEESDGEEDDDDEPAETGARGRGRGRGERPSSSRSRTGRRPDRSHGRGQRQTSSRQARER